MNLQPETRFSEERLVAFLLGLLDADAEAELQRAADADSELAMQLQILASMLPPRGDAAAAEAASKPGQAETRAHADTLDAASADSASLPPELHRAARLQAEGASVAEIARATNTTQALVRIQLQQIEVLRRRSP